MLSSDSDNVVGEGEEEEPEEEEDLLVERERDLSQWSQFFFS